MSGTTKPERYVVYWPDYALRARIARRDGCAPEDIDPADYEASRDFDRLEDARAFLASPAVAWDGSTSTIADVGGWIEERVNLRPDEWSVWDWDQDWIEP
jgi:hypothetical protein